MNKAARQALLARVEALQEVKKKKHFRYGKRSLPKVKPKTVTLHLTMGHRINGEPYGPGQVWVTEPIAAVLRENEARAVEGERLLFIRQAHVIELGKSGPRTRSVPPELFENYMDGAIPLSIGGA